MKIPRNFLVRRQLRELTKHFFGRFFDSEVFAAPGADMHRLFIQILALLVIPGLFRTFVSVGTYFMLAFMPAAMVEQAVVVDEYFFLCLSMILTGFITVFEWETLFPDRKDFHNLTPLPIKPRILFSAKVAALSFFIVLSNLAINGVPILIFPGIVLSHSNRLGADGAGLSAYESMMYPVGNAISLFLSSLFVFTSFIAIRAAISLICPAKLVRKVSRFVQLASILVLVCTLFSGADANRLIAEGNGLVFVSPPFWFLGLFEAFIGHHAPVYSTLAKTAVLVSASAFILSILGYITGYRSSMQKGFQSAGAACYHFTALRRTWTWILHKVLLKHSVERASFHFIAQTVFRRQKHMLYWGSFISVGIAVICWCLYKNESGFRLESFQNPAVLMSFPLIISFFTLVGLRYVFSVPADLNANWIFKTVDKKKLEHAYSGVRKFMLCAAGIPLLTIFGPWYLLILDHRLALYHLSYVFMLSWILIELLLLRFKKLPFACSYIPGKANIKAFWLPYLLSFAAFSFGAAALELWMLQHITACIAFVLTAGVGIIGLSRYRSSFLREIHAIQFEEEQENAVIVLTIEG